MQNLTSDRIAIFVFIFLKTSHLQPADLTDLWVVWNIGQGQWVTHVVAGQCRHFDVGGEPGRLASIKPALQRLCYTRENQIILSHWDMDHYAHIVSLSKAMPRICWLSQPVAAPETASALNVARLPIKPCASFDVNRWAPKTFHTSNESSSVFQEEHFLLPGDSPIADEHLWTRQLKNLERVRVLILGHHGSRTSTGSELLRALGSLKMTVASARFQKYHHPHFSTVQRIRDRRVPLLKTEDWGNIYFE